MTGELWKIYGMTGESQINKVKWLYSHLLVKWWIGSSLLRGSKFTMTPWLCSDYQILNPFLDPRRLDLNYFKEAILNKKFFHYQ